MPAHHIIVQAPVCSYVTDNLMQPTLQIGFGCLSLRLADRVCRHASDGMCACNNKQIMHLITFRYSFPCRLEACQSIISLIQAHTDMDIVLGIDSLGKGRLNQVLLACI